MRAILLTATIGLIACENSAETSNDSQSPTSAIDTAKAADLVVVTRPWIRPTAPGQTVSGAFMTLVNDSGTPYALTSVGFAGARVVEIHETSMSEGMMRMRKVDQIEIPAHGSAELKPGSFHVMLIGLDRDMKTGTTETLKLTFSDGSQKAVEAPVGTAGE